MATRFFLGTSLFTLTDVCSIIKYLHKTTTRAVRLIDVSRIAKFVAGLTCVRMTPVAVPFLTVPTVVTALIEISSLKPPPSVEIFASLLLTDPKHYAIVDFQRTEFNEDLHMYHTAACIRVMDIEGGTPTHWPALAAVNNDLFVINEFPSSVPFTITTANGFELPISTPLSDVPVRHIIATFDETVTTIAFATRTSRLVNGEIVTESVHR